MAITTATQAPPAEVMPDESPVKSLESRAMRATSYIFIFYALALSLRIVNSIALSRLFNPTYFGILSLLTTVLIGLQLFTHIGLEDSIIQNPRGDDPVFLNTAWTLQVIRGFGLWLATIPLAWPVARFYHEPSMMPLLPVLGFGCVIAGFSSPSLFVLARHLGVGKLSVFELVGQVTLLVATVAWALVHRSIWALAFGRLASEMVRTLVSYRLGPRMRPKFVWDKVAVGELVRFGRWIMLSTSLTFLAVQSDKMILGKLVSFQMLGIYGIAYSLSDLPRQIISQFCTRVGYPFIAKFSSKPRPEYRAILLKYRSLVLLGGALMIILVICIGDLFITRVYDKRYHEAAWMIGILAIGLWHTLLYSTIAPAILSLQKPHYNALAYGTYCISLFILLPLGYYLMGMPGAIIGIAISDFPVYMVNGFSAQREGIAVWWQDLWCTGVFMAALAAAILLRKIAGHPVPFPALHMTGFLHG